MIRLTLVLALITFIAALALGFVYQSTAPKIEEQKRLTEELARKTALPRAACGVFVPVEVDGFLYYEGYANPDTTDLVGYAVKAAGAGYSSTIETIVGVDIFGRITGMKITSQQETPGLGTRIEEVKTTKTVLDALKELSGKPKPRTVSVDVTDSGGIERCLKIELRDEPMCGHLESLVAAGDTLGIQSVASRALSLAPQDSALVFSDPGLLFDVSKKVIEGLRSQVMPWFQLQFVGRKHENLVLTRDASGKHIQAITGATISSAAVTESVSEAIKLLGVKIGGFKEAQP